MNNVDNRIVNLQFNNKDFEKNAAQSIKTCDELEKKLSFKGVNNGLGNLNSWFKSVNNTFTSLSLTIATIFKPIEDGAASAAQAFNPLEEMAVGALRRIGEEALQTGEKVLRAITVDQIESGYSKFDEKTQSVQTIMSATGKSIKEVNEQLEKLNWYTDETSYAYTDMTNNIGKFTNAGIELEDAVTAMIGIGNAAGLAGANVQDASHAMAGMAKAIGQGYMDMMTWNWIQTAHMDTVGFKKELIAAGEAAGVLKKVGDGAWAAFGDTSEDALVTVAAFDRTLSKSKWLTSDIMIDTLKKYGATTQKIYDAANADDFETPTSELIDQLGISMDDLGLKAFRASQEAKTFTDAIEAVKDAVSTGWMKSFETIIGNYEQAKVVWTDLANWLYDVVAESGNARNKLLEEWRDDWTFGLNELGGREYLFEGIYEIFKTLTEYIHAVGDAFTKVFGEDWDATLLYNITQGIHDFAQALAQTVENGVFDYETKGTIKWFITTAEQIFWILKRIGETISNVTMVFGKAITEAFGFKSVTDAFSESWEDAATAIDSNATKIGKVLYRVFHSVNAFITKTFYGEDAEKRIAKVANDVGSIIKDLKDIFISVATSIAKAIGTINSSFGEITYNSAEGLLSFIKLITSNILKLVSATNAVTGTTKVTDIFVGVLNICKGIVSFLKIGKNIATFIFKTVSTFVNEIKKKVSESGIVDVLTTEILELGNAVKRIFTAISGQSEKLKDNADDSERSFGWVTLIADVMIDAINVITKLIPLATKLANKVAGFIESIKLFIQGEEPNSTGEKKNTIVDILKHSIETIFDEVDGGKVTDGAKKFSGSVFEGIFNGITNAIKNLNIDWGKVGRFAAFIGFLTGMVLLDASLYKLFRMFTGIGGIFGGVNEFITGVVGVVTSVQKYISTMSILDQMKTLALAIAILSGAVWLLAQLPREALARGIVALGLIATIFGVLMKVLNTSAPLINHQTGANNSILAGAFSNSSLVKVGTGRFGLAAMIFGLVAFVMAVVHAINSLSKLSVGSVLKGLGTIIVISGMLTVMILALSLMAKRVQDVYTSDLTTIAGTTKKINQSKASNYFLTLSATIVSIAVAVLAFAAALNSIAVVAQKNPEGFWKACLAFIGIMVFFSAFVAFLAGVDIVAKKNFDISGIEKKLLVAASAMVVIAVAFNLLTIPLLILSKLQKVGVDLNGIMLTVFEYVGIITAFIGALSIIGTQTKTVDMLKSVGALLAVAVVMNILVVPLKSMAKLQMNNVDFEALFIDIMKYIGGILAIMMILTYFMKSMTASDVAKASGIFLVAALAVIAITNPLAKLGLLQLSGVDYDSLIGNIILLIGTVAGIALALAGFTKAFNAKSMLVASGSLLVVSMAISMIIKSLKSLSEYPDLTTLGGIAIILVVMAGVLAGLMALSKSLDNSASLLKIAASMVVMSVAVIAIAGAFAILNKYASGLKWSTIGQVATIIGVLTVALVALGAAATYINGVLPVMSAVASILTALAIVIASFGITLLLVAKALPIITNNLPLFMDTVKDAANAMEDHIGVFLIAAGVIIALTALVTVLLITFVKNLPGLLSTLDTFINSIAEMSLRGKAVTAAFVLALAWGLAEATPEVMDAIEVAIGLILERLGQIVGWLVDGLLKLIIQLLHGLADAIRENAGAILFAIVDILEAIGELLVDAIAVTLGNLANLIAAAIMAIGDKVKHPEKTFAEAYEEAFTGLTESMGDSITAFKEAAKLGMVDLQDYFSGLGYSAEIKPFGDPEDAEKQGGEFFDKLIAGGKKAVADAGDKLGVNEELQKLKDKLLGGELISSEEFTKLFNMEGFDITKQLDLESFMNQNMPDLNMDSFKNFNLAESAFTDLSDTVIDGSADMELATVNLTDTVGDETGEWVNDVATNSADAETALADGVDKLELVVNNRQDNFREAGKNLIGALQEGVDEKWESVSGIIKSKFQKLADDIKDILSKDNLYSDISPVINADDPYKYVASNRPTTATTQTDSVQAAATEMNNLQNTIVVNNTRLENLVRLTNDKLDSVISGNDIFHKSFSAYRNEQKDLSVYMDSGALVGAIAEDMSNELVKIANRGTRSGG